ncbi:MAG: hypothetical protein ABSF81_15595 [Bacteroidales bacterium]|jgi:hypothetical protein
MDAKEEYKDLTDKITKNIPLTALPIRELVKINRDNEQPITLGTELILITSYLKNMIFVSNG